MLYFRLDQVKILLKSFRVTLRLQLCILYRMIHKEWEIWKQETLLGLTQTCLIRMDIQGVEN